MNRRQWRQPAARAAALAVAASMALAATPGAIGSEAGAAAGETDTSSAPGPCDEGWTAPAPTAVPVTAVPIEVASTTDDYFVLYVTLTRWSGSGTFEIPVSVTRGESGATALSDNLPPLAADKYRVEKYQVAQPADVDGDCVDDLTELDDLGAYNPTNRAPRMDIADGAVAIASHDDFEALRSTNSFVRLEGNQIDVMKFWIGDLDTDDPSVYFMNTDRHQWHYRFEQAMNLRYANSHRGALAYDPNVIAPDGTLGVYRYYFWSGTELSFERVETFHAILAAAMPVVREHNNLAYYQVLRTPARIAQFEAEKAKYEASRVNMLLFEDLMPDVDYVPFNQAEGYGLLRLMEDGEQPRPTDIAIYESLPNDLPRVAGTISTIPQTPLAHVNLRAIQNNVPNAFIRDILKDEDLKALIGKHVYYSVTADGYALRAATKKEVDDHHAAARPTAKQTPQRDLTVTKITPLADVAFDNWDAFGVKAANTAELSKLDLPEGTVPEGFAVPFYFYDEFMKANDLYDYVAEMLADSDFQSDYGEQEKELKKLRKKIKKATTPDWIIEALEEMHGAYPEGTSLRYRSSTNNEDLPAFNGAGLYSSKTQDPDETAEDGIDKSIKAVWASLWNYRAFLERDYYRVDHATTAMGVLVHPNYSDELANGVAVSYDPVFHRDGMYYINTQVGEDLVTNPEANSYPEELLLDSDGKATVLARSNLAEPGKLLMSEAQMVQLRNNLKTVHDRFKALYNVQDGDDYAIEIEFKITSADKLAIKQARPWVFAPPLPLNPATSSAPGPRLFTASEHALPENKIHVVLLEYSRPRGEIRFTFSGPDTRHFKLYGASDLLVFEAQDYHAPADADGDGVYEFELTATDSGAGSTTMPMRFTVTEAVLPEVNISGATSGEEGQDATFTLLASPAPSAPLTVSVTVTADGDFGVSTGSRTVSVGTGGTATLTIATVDDDADERDGSVSLSLNTGDGYTVGLLSADTTSVLDNDDAPLVAEPEVTVTAGGAVTEGAGAVFTVAAEPAPDAPLSVNVTVGQDGDFGASTGSRTVTVGTGGTATLTVATVDDDADERDGSLSVTVDSGDGYTVSSGHASATVNVADDDDPPPIVVPEVTVTAGGAVTEGAGAVFTVAAEPAPDAPLSVNVTVGQDGDFGASTGSRTVTVGTGGTATLTVATVDDDADERDGSLSVTVDSGDGYTVSSGHASATVNVADDDDPPPIVVPEVSVADASIVEGEMGALSPLEFRVALSEASEQDVTVRYVIRSGTATDGLDYWGGTGQVTIGAGRTSGLIGMNVKDDILWEGDETLTVELTDADGAVIADGRATGTIIDDDD